MSECGATTRVGTPCRKKKATGKEHCRIHSDMSECAICLNSIIARSERNTRTLPCNHKFHTACINRWKRQGNYTCPICRHEFDIPEYNITIIIEARRTRERMITTNLESSQLVGQHIVDTFDLPRDNAIEYMTEIVLEADNMDELESALRNDLGIDLNEINMTINNNEAETSP
jgi:hypothetical protein